MPFLNFTFPSLIVSEHMRRINIQRKEASQEVSYLMKSIKTDQTSRRTLVIAIHNSKFVALSYRRLTPAQFDS